MADFVGFLKQAVPFLATALGSPAAGLAATFLADRLGLPDKSVEAVKNALSGMPPEQIIQLKTIELDFKKFMEELGYKKLVDLERLAVEDRKSAREREVATGDTTTRNLATLYTGGYFVSFGIILLNGLPPGEGVKEVVISLISIMSAAQLAIIGYYFGSSNGSGSKNVMFKDAMDKIIALVGKRDVIDPEV